jgi:arginase
VTVILVPYHLDEHRPDLDYPLEPDVAVTAELPAGDVWERLGTLYSNVAAQVAATARAGGRPVVLSGDCTTSLGTMAGLQRAGVDAGIVWFDAHGDVQTLETTSSGYLGGIPLRVLAGYRPELIAGRLGLRSVPEAQIALVDARDLDPPEADYLAGAQIRQLPVDGLDAADLPGGPLYLRVDLDVIHSAAPPGLLFPAPGGPAPGAGHGGPAAGARHRPGRRRGRRLHLAGRARRRGRGAGGAGRGAGRMAVGPSPAAGKAGPVRDDVAHGFPGGAWPA